MPEHRQHTHTYTHTWPSKRFICFQGPSETCKGAPNACHVFPQAIPQAMTFQATSSNLRRFPQAIVMRPRSFAMSMKHMPQTVTFDMSVQFSEHFQLPLCDPEARVNPFFVVLAKVAKDDFQEPMRVRSTRSRPTPRFERSRSRDVERLRLGAWSGGGAAARRQLAPWLCLRAG